MEDANGILSISEGSFPTIGRKSKAFGKYEGWRMRDSWQKGNGKNTIVPGNIDGFQYFKRNDNKGFDEGIS